MGHVPIGRVGIATNAVWSEVQPTFEQRDALLAACKALRAIIHDDLTHARQADHAEAIAAADAAIAKAEGHVK